MASYSRLPVYIRPLTPPESDEEYEFRSSKLSTIDEESEPELTDTEVSREPRCRRLKCPPSPFTQSLPSSDEKGIFDEGSFYDSRFPEISPRPIFGTPKPKPPEVKEKKTLPDIKQLQAEFKKKIAFYQQNGMTFEQEMEGYDLLIAQEEAEIARLTAAIDRIQREGDEMMPAFRHEQRVKLRNGNERIRLLTEIDLASKENARLEPEVAEMKSYLKLLKKTKAETFKGINKTRITMTSLRKNAVTLKNRRRKFMSKLEILQTCLNEADIVIEEAEAVLRKELEEIQTKKVADKMNSVSMLKVMERKTLDGKRVEDECKRKLAEERAKNKPKNFLAINRRLSKAPPKKKETKEPLGRQPTPTPKSSFKGKQTKQNTP